MAGALGRMVGRAVVGYGGLAMSPVGVAGLGFSGVGGTLERTPPFFLFIMRPRKLSSAPGLSSVCCFFQGRGGSACSFNLGYLKETVMGS